MNRHLILMCCIAAAGCRSADLTGNGAGDPPSNAIESAHVLVDGQPVEGTVVSGAHGATLFQVTMRNRDPRHLAEVHQVLIRYEVPAGGMMSMRSGQEPCFDDGTHGDDLAGDGVYHRSDDAGTMGCGHSGAAAGDYAYGFHCVTTSGRSCGDMTIGVRRQ